MTISCFSCGAQKEEKNEWYNSETDLQEVENVN